jgi:hypothetical protein
MSTTMSDAQLRQLQPGTLLIAPDTALPPGWTLDADALVSGWCRVCSAFSDRQLDRELGADGWTFLFRAGAIKTTAFGWGTNSTVASGVIRLIAEARRQGCNCLQIDSVRMQSLLGMPYARLAAHSRHIQKDAV